MGNTRPISGIASVDAFDVIVVGAGLSGVYALHRLQSQGLKVFGLEGGEGVGGVWLHNRYPGARVDIESTDYCYYFSPEIYREWAWSERYAAQPELLRYINFVADRVRIKPHIRFNTWMDGAQWKPESTRWDVKTSAGESFRARFLVMATGNLSAARKPPFLGLEDFQGEWAQTSHWPDRPIAFTGRRIGVIGTGSSGVQSIPVLAEKAEHLYVFQRSPNYSVPAQNGPIDDVLYQRIRSRVSDVRRALMDSFGAMHITPPQKRAGECTHAEREALLERQWAVGGQGMGYVFVDQGTNAAANEVVAEFVRDKIRSIVKDPELAEKLCPRDHAIGTRRLCIDTGYYETFNRGTVTLVDIAADPIEKLTKTGLKTRDRFFELDLIIFALGFHAFRGAMDNTQIRNEKGEGPTDSWNRGPQTYLGLTTVGFPNFFFLNGPGSPSVLSNHPISAEYHADWVADCIGYLDKNNLKTIEPTIQAQDAWSSIVAQAAASLLRLKTRNYMVHRNEDGSGVFIPYVGGFNRYRAMADAVAQRSYEGFVFT